ncbi:sensor histidine kinase [Paenibacillus andongensis]|uniref:sensor histidine kinase n=1 Tax=Paenibacillus andongensis TaxID=2975482 RepID=UPI0021BB5510|nr:sensor histidine kinase [Paenibacillus andongensis]
MARLNGILQKWYYDLSIIKKIIFSSIITIVIPIILLAALANKVSSNIIIQKTMDNSFQNLELLTQGLDSLLNSAEHSANILIANNFVQDILSQSKMTDSLERLNNEKLLGVVMDSVLEPRNEASTAVIYANYNFTVGSGFVNPSKLKTEAMNSDLQDERFKAENSKWIDMYKIHYETTQPSTNVISFKKNIIGYNNGAVLGNILININEEIISNNYSQLHYGINGRYFIVNEKGSIVSSQNKSEIFKNISNESYFIQAKEMILGNQIVDIQSEKYLITSKHFERMHWIVMGVIPLDEITADNSKVSFIIYLAGFICVLLAVLSSILLSRSISMPLVKLSKSIKKMGLGDFDVTIPTLGNDEVGVVSRRFNIMTKQISELIDQVYEEQQKKRNYELLALQAQIHPHFLYNTLESVCSLVQMNRNEDAFQMVKALARFYRFVLSKGEKAITIREELQIAENYLMIQKFRYQDKFDFKINVDPQLLNNLIICLSIQPILENCLYHGIRNIRKKGLIAIEGYQEGDKAILYVSDDGVGMNEDEITQIFANEKTSTGRSSFGIRSVSERIKLFFGQEYGIQIYSTIGHGTRVKIILPVLQKTEESWDDQSIDRG